MTTRNYSSRSQQTTLTSAATAGASTIVVQSGTALLGGQSIPAGTTFTIVIDPDTAIEEIVDATAVSTNTFTITRAIDGSSAQAHSAGAVVRHMAIGRDYREANAHIEASTGVHGISNASSVVGTTDTQTLTNKTLTAPTITNPSISGAGVDASIVFEGATADAYETTLTVVDPTQDNTLTLPNTTGTVVVATATQTLTNKTLTSPTISGSPVITGLSSAGMVASSATPKDYVDSILGSATAAATSAASAATSATSAATSATSAASSASAAAGSATSSANSATAAATSATSAAASATAAATSATSSAASATTAQAWAIQLVTPVSGTDYSAKYNANLAATSASSASTSASSAATSASSAATSATNAANSATASASSASAAATSATSAAASATAAATSATSAAASATAAATSATSAAASATAAAGYVVPSQTGNAGKYLQTDGSTTSWQLVSGDISSVTAGTGLSGGGTSGAVTVSLDTSSVYVVPSQTGNAGKFLITDGTNSSWSTTVLGTFVSNSASGDADSARNISLQIDGTTYGRIVVPTGSGGAMAFWTGSTPAERVRITSTGLFGINGTASGTQLLVNNGTAANVGAIIKGAASQTGDLLQVQNSAGTVLATVTSAGYVGINNSSPETFLHVGSASGTSSGSAIMISGQVNAERLHIRSAGNTGPGTSAIALLGGRNTISSPTATQSGDQLGYYQLGGYDGTAWIRASWITGTAEENWTSTARGSNLSFFTTPNGSTTITERMRIDNAGNTTINAIADATTTTAARGGGYMGIPQSAAAGSGAYTVVAADAGEHIYTTTTRTVTIPANASVAFPVGTVLSFISGVGATTTIAITSDTMYLAGAGTTGSRTLAAHGMATAVKVASTTWYISGNGLT